MIFYQRVIILNLFDDFVAECHFFCRRVTIIHFVQHGRNACLCYNYILFVS